MVYSKMVDTGDMSAATEPSACTYVGLRVSYPQVGDTPDAILISQGWHPAGDAGTWELISSESTLESVDVHIQRWLTPLTPLIQQMKATYAGISLTIVSHLWNAIGFHLPANAIKQIALLDAGFNLYSHSYGEIEAAPSNCSTTSLPIVETSEPSDTIVSLRIFAPELNPTVVTQQLGITPDRQHLKGDHPKNNPRYAAYKDGMWIIGSHVSREAPLEMHLQAVCNRLLLVRSQLETLRQTAIVDFYCTIFASDTVALSAAVLQDMATLGVEFGASMYV